MAYRNKGCLYVFRSGVVWKKFDGDENFYTEPLDLTKSVHRRLMQAIKENVFKDGKHLNMHTEFKLKDDDYFQNKNWVSAEKIVDDLIYCMLKAYCYGRLGEGPEKIADDYRRAEEKLSEMVESSPNGEKALKELNGILADMVQNLTSDAIPTSEYVSLSDAQSLINKKHMVQAVNASQIFVDIKSRECLNKKKQSPDEK